MSETVRGAVHSLSARNLAVLATAVHHHLAGRLVQAGEVAIDYTDDDLDLALAALRDVLGR